MAVISWKFLENAQNSWKQTWKMSETLPEQDFSFPYFTQKCVNYLNFKIATKQLKLGTNTMFTTFTSLHRVYLINTETKKIRHNKSHRLVLGWGESSSSAGWISIDGSSSLSLLVTKESALLAMETKFHLGKDSGQGFIQIIPYPAGWVTLPSLGKATQPG